MLQVFILGAICGGVCGTFLSLLILSGFSARAYEKGRKDAIRQMQFEIRERDIRGGTSGVSGMSGCTGDSGTNTYIENKN